MTLAIDISNYTSVLTVAKLHQWQVDGVGLVIIQAFPTSYHQYAEQCAQVEACSDAGMPFDYYVYDYLASTSWRDGAIEGIRQLFARGYTARRLWADEEDVSVGASPAHVIPAIAATLKALDLTPSRLNPSGVYSGGWWWKPYTGNYQGFADRPWWTSQYDGNPDAEVVNLWGGWSTCTIKQYAGTSVFDGVSGVDLNVLSVADAATLIPTPVPPVAPPEEPQPMAIKVGQGMLERMKLKKDSPLFGHRFYTEVDDDGVMYSVEECYGQKGRYISSNSNGAWVNTGPI